MHKRNFGIFLDKSIIFWYNNYRKLRKGFDKNDDVNGKFNFRDASW